MSRARRWHAVRSAQWSRAAEGRACSALLLAAHELREVAEAAAGRAGEEAELAANLHALAQGVEQPERDVLGAFCSAADRQLEAEEANPPLPLEAS